MGWQFYGLCAVVALLGLIVMLLSTQIQMLLKMRELLEKRLSEESKHLIVEGPKKQKKKKGFLPTDPPRM